MRLRVDVLKKENVDCTNGGMTSRFNSFILVWDEADPPEEINGTPVLELIEREIYGKRYLHSKPVCEGSGVGPMAGGNFIYSSDSRFPNDYPISVHDRWETADEYRMLSS